MWLSFYLIWKPIGTLLSFIPFFEDIVNFAAGIITLIGAIATSSLIIAIAWFTHRPIISTVIILVGFGIAFGIKKAQLGKRK